MTTLTLRSPLTPIFESTFRVPLQVLVKVVANDRSRSLLRFVGRGRVLVRVQHRTVSVRFSSVPRSSQLPTQRREGSYQRSSRSAGGTPTLVPNDVAARPIGPGRRKELTVRVLTSRHPNIPTALGRSPPRMSRPTEQPPAAGADPCRGWGGLRLRLMITAGVVFLLGETIGSAARDDPRARPLSPPDPPHPPLPSLPNFSPSRKLLRGVAGVVGTHTAV